jgi:formate hydrogenlyase subunit 5
MLDQVTEEVSRSRSLPELCRSAWKGRVVANADHEGLLCHLKCGAEELRPVCEWLTRSLGFSFATLIVEEEPESTWTLKYLFYKNAGWPWASIEFWPDAIIAPIPSISAVAHAADWHEREAEDLFGLVFEGHPRLGDFILHEDWPEGINPMRRAFDVRQPPRLRQPEAKWEAPTIVSAPGAFAMPIGPVFSDFAESAHFLLETVGEDVIHTIPRLFYKYRGLEKIAEGQPLDRVLLLAERFSGTSAFAHGLAFCQAVEAICRIEVPLRARMLRTVFAELERLRHHAAAITGICNSTALAVATSQAALIEENLLRLTCEVARHRYLFGVLEPGGLTFDITEETCGHLSAVVSGIAEELADLHRMLRYSSSFLDRLEEVGVVSTENAHVYGLVGPVARASGVGRDIRQLFPYQAYQSANFTVPVEAEGDGYARLRILFREAEQSASIIRQSLAIPAGGSVRTAAATLSEGAAFGAVEAPLGAAFHWVRVRENGTVARYRVTPPSFANWHGFHLAAENFAFQDFPIILASFGLSNAECDR